MKNIVKIKNLHKTYGETKAVRGLTFNIKQGEIFGFLGPNGAGKTSTIGCITQLNKITKGTIQIDGFDVEKDYLQARKRIGLSQQEINLDPYFKVIDTLEYTAGYFGVPKKQARKKCEHYLKKFDLWDKRNDDTRKLSGGMKRKLSIIKAILHDPKILILDEPTAGLDVDSRYELWEFIKEQNKKGTTIILTTHYIEEAEQLSDRIGIINKGKLLKLEKKEKIIDDLSHNIITITLSKQNTKTPKELKELDIKREGRKIHIQTTKAKQNKHLQKALKIFEKNKITIENFDIKQDNLENIFRRILKNE